MSISAPRSNFPTALKRAGRLFSWLLAGALMLLAVTEAASAGVVSVRVGEHDTFNRIVFDWDQAVDYTVEADEQTIDIVFSVPVDIDFSQLLNDTPPLIESARAVRDGATTRVEIHLVRPASFRHFRDGRKVVLDIMGEELTFDTGRAAPVAGEKSSTANSTGNGGGAAEESTGTGTGSDGAPVSEFSKVLDNLKADEEAAAATPAPPPFNGTVAPDILSIDNGISMRIALPETVAAAIFQRFNRLWVVFGREMPVDLSSVSVLFSDYVRKPREVDVAGATVLYFTLPPDRYVTAREEGFDWIIEVSSRPVVARKPLEIRRRDDAKIGTRLYVPSDGFSAAVRMTDPDVGDEIVAVPLAANGYGVFSPRRFAEFQVLATAQGMAVVPNSDQVLVEPGDHGLTIDGAEVLVVADASQSIIIRKDPSLPRTFLPEGGDSLNGGAVGRVIDLAAWRRDKEGDAGTVRRNLLYSLATAPESQRQAERFNLARFYVAQHMPADALGVIDVMAADDALLKDRADFRALRGIARFMFQRFQGAEEDLSFAALSPEPHAALWRAAVAEVLGKHEEAIREYRRGTDVLWEYTDAEKAVFRLAAIKASMALEDYDTARKELVELATVELPVSEASEAELMRGKLYEVLKEDRNALASYDRVVAADYRPTAVAAKLDRDNVLLRTANITRPKAIGDLETLRYLWRGDELELSVLHRLGDLYIQNGDYRNGLSTIRMAITYFDKSDETREIAKEMSGVFRQLFLEGKADRLSPVEALALYYDFRELTPIGAEGDEMIRRLSDRLVAVDLLDRAEELLEHQITYRLKGTPQAQVAAQLAVIQLLDNKPAKALETIDKTRQPKLPEDLAMLRRHLESRALAGMKEYAEAEQLLEGDSSAEANVLRSDIYWSAQDWGRLARLVEGQIGQRWQSSDPLEPRERQQILRLVVAMALDGDQPGLVRIRKDYLEFMRGGPFFRSFDVITSNLDFDGLELNDLVKNIADVSMYQDFLANYRDEMSRLAFTGIN